MERDVHCPQCGRLIRSTEQKLAIKRGFCGACQARFDILPELVVGEGPMRQLTVAEVQLSPAPSPSKRMEVTETESEVSVDLRPDRAAGTVPAVFSALGLAYLVLCGVDILFFHGSAYQNLVLLLVGILWLVYYGPRAMWPLFGRERVRIDRASVVHEVALEPFVRWRAEPMTQPFAATTSHKPQNKWSLSPRSDGNEWTVSLMTEGERAVEIARGAKLSENEADWLFDFIIVRIGQVRHALLKAAGEQPPELPPSRDA